MTTRMILPLEEHQHATPCPACQGRGVTGARYDMPTGGDVVLVLEVFCPVCGGCGNGDPDHGGCEAIWHADPDADTGEPPDGAWDDGDELACWSCGSGRGWYPVQGFTETEAYTLRGLCGCSESRLVPVES